MLGLGPLEPLLEDESITDIMVNGPNRVFVERQGKVVLSDIRSVSYTHLDVYKRQMSGSSRSISS